MTLPLLPGASTLRAGTTIVSRPYLDATVQLLAEHGVRWPRSGRAFSIEGPVRYSGTSFRVPGDVSSAAYLWAGAAITGGRVRTTGLDLRWAQADVRCLDVLEEAGAEVRRARHVVEVQGRVSAPIEVDLTEAPDLLPLLAVVASRIPGRSRLVGAGHSTWKESDRRAYTERLVRALGARTRLSPRLFEIDGAKNRPAHRLPPLPDHRLVMSAAVGALAARRPTWVGPAEAVRKSFPGFWSALEALGAPTGVRP